MVSVCVSLKIKGSEKTLPQETMAAGENLFAPKLNENEVIELLEDLSNVSVAFLVRQLFLSRLLDMR